MEAIENESCSTTDDLRIADFLKEYETAKSLSSVMDKGRCMMMQGLKSVNNNTTPKKKQTAVLLKSLSKDIPIASYALLIVLMIVVIILLQTPTILYFTAPPSTADSPLLGSINFETCTVSSMKMKIISACINRFNEKMRHYITSFSHNAYIREKGLGKSMETNILKAFCTLHAKYSLSKIQN